MIKQRILWIDSIKAFAILIVILGHCLQFIGATGILYKYIYAVHMPLFMAISGYCSYKQSISFGHIKRRFFQLVVPFFCWPLVWYAIKMDFSGIADYYIHLPLNPDTGLWFLYILFLISLVDFLRCKLLLNSSLQKPIGGGKLKLTQYNYECSVIVTSVLLLLAYWIYKHLGMPGNWINFLALYYPYYILGCEMRRHNELFLNHLYWIGPLGLAVYLGLTYFLKGELYEPLLATGGILGVFFIFYKWCNIKTPQLIMFTGVSTLGIYAVHQPVIQSVKHLTETPIWLDVVITFVLSYFISIFSVWLLKSSGITRKLLLGMQN